MSATLAMYWAYHLTEIKLERLQTQHVRDWAALTQRHMLWYGEVSSVDVSARTLTVTLRDQFVSTNNPVQFIIRTTPETVFLYEKLLEEDGAYVGLKQIHGRTVADIVPHMRVAILVDTKRNDNTVIAKTVIFGNPL